jgi:hypothetical protein
MDSDREHHADRVPLAGYQAADQDPDAGLAGSAAARRAGLRQTRRLSNWTAAALLVSTGAAAVALAHNALPATATTGTAAAAGTTAGGTTTATGAGGPAVTHSVATTSGSGVTVTTVRHIVNGKAVVTRVRHVVAYHDN